MITLKQLTWSNCFSYAENNVLNLNDSNLIQILGLNGAGKSSIPLIIEEVLFNKNSKGIKKAEIPNRLVDKGYDINLTFSKDGDEYEVDVVRRTGVKVKLFKNGDDISSHTATGTYKTIQSILGMDFKTFSQLVYQNPKSSLQFLTATDTNRKKFLVELLNLQEYTRLFESFKTQAKEFGDEKIASASSVKTISSWLERNAKEDLEEKSLKAEPSRPDVDLQHLGDLKSKKASAAATNKKIAQNNQYKKLLDKIDVSTFQGVENRTPQSYDSLQVEKGEIQGDIRSYKAKIKEAEAVEDTCPTCGQDLDVDTDFYQKVIEETKIKLVEAEKQLEIVSSSIKQIQADNADLTAKRKKQKEWEDLYRSVDPDLPEDLINVQTVQLEIDELEKQLEEFDTKVAGIKRYNKTVEEHNAKVRVLKEQTESMRKDLEAEEKNLRRLNDICADFEVLKKAFSTNGLIAYKIENLVKELEELVNEYLSELSDGRFTLSFVVSQDKLNVVITDEGQEVNILALSTGELAKVNTSTLIAIRKLMNSISSSRINVLFLDEVISVLDDFGKERLVEVLLREKDLNTYAVSHGWSHPLVSKIEVIKEDGLSHLQY